jgi:dethiobiotin synthase
MTALIVTGTDTDVGKTVVSAMLTLVLDGVYWKPVQAGVEGTTDRERVQALTGLGRDRFVPERYVIRAPLSPHRAAELDGIEIDPENLALPSDVASGRRLIIEGAGGVLVPLNRRMLQAELFARWRAPVILCARTRLGTINHTLLSLEALRRHDVRILGIVFVGDAMPDTEQTIAAFGRTKVLGRLPMLPVLSADALRAAFDVGFHAQDFEAVHAW